MKLKTILSKMLVIMLAVMMQVVVIQANTEKINAEENKHKVEIFYGADADLAGNEATSMLILRDTSQNTGAKSGGSVLTNCEWTGYSLRGYHDGEYSNNSASGNIENRYMQKSIANISSIDVYYGNSQDGYVKATETNEQLNNSNGAYVYLKEDGSLVSTTTSHGFGGKDGYKKLLLKNSPSGSNIAFWVPYFNDDLIIVINRTKNSYTKYFKNFSCVTFDDDTKLMADNDGYFVPNYYGSTNAFLTSKKYGFKYALQQEKELSSIDISYAGTYNYSITGDDLGKSFYLKKNSDDKKFEKASDTDTPDKNNTPMFFDGSISQINFFESAGNWEIVAKYKTTGEEKVTFNLNGGKIGDSTDPIEIPIVDGHIDEYPENPEKEGYVFLGWYKNLEINTCGGISKSSYKYSNNELDFTDSIELKAAWGKYRIEVDCGTGTLNAQANFSYFNLETDSSSNSLIGYTTDDVNDAPASPETGNALQISNQGDIDYVEVIYGNSSFYLSNKNSSTEGVSVVSGTLYCDSQGNLTADSAGNKKILTVASANGGKNENAIAFRINNLSNNLKIIIHNYNTVKFNNVSSIGNVDFAKRHIDTVKNIIKVSSNENDIGKSVMPVFNSEACTGIVISDGKNSAIINDFSKKYYLNSKFELLEKSSPFNDNQIVFDNGKFTINKISTNIIVDYVTSEMHTVKFINGTISSSEWSRTKGTIDSTTLEAKTFDYSSTEGAKIEFKTDEIEQNFTLKVKVGENEEKSYDFAYETASQNVRLKNDGSIVKGTPDKNNDVAVMVHNANQNSVHIRFYNIKEDITFEIVGTKKELVFMNGDSEVKRVKDVDFGSKLDDSNLPDESKLGNNFRGWYALDSINAKTYKFDKDAPVTASRTYYAQYKNETYDLIIDHGVGCGFISEKLTTAITDETFSDGNIYLQGKVYKGYTYQGSDAAISGVINNNRYAQANGYSTIDSIDVYLDDLNTAVNTINNMQAQTTRYFYLDNSGEYCVGDTLPGDAKLMAKLAVNENATFLRIVDMKCNIKIKFYYKTDVIVDVLQKTGLKDDGTIDLGFKVKLPSNIKADDCYIDVDGEVIKLSKLTNDGTGYNVDIEGFAIKNMSDLSKMKLFDSYGNQITNDINTSTEKYLRQLLDSDDITNEKIKLFAKTMLNYGSYTQKYFAGKNQYTGNQIDLTGLDMQSEIKDVEKDNLTSYKITDNNPLCGVSLHGMSLSLKNNTYMNIYLDYEDDVNLYVFKCDDDVVGYEVYIDPSTGQTHYCYRINKGFKAQDLDKPHTITVFKNDVEVYKLENCSPLSYAYKVLNSSRTGDIVNLVKVLYLYNQNSINACE